MYNYRDLIRIYARGVAGGTNDPELKPRQRRLAEVMLNLASNAHQATEAYPPSGDTREAAIKHLADISWEARALVMASSPGANEDYSAALERTLQILRSL